MREVSPIEGRPRKVRTLTTDERSRLFVVMDRFVVESCYYSGSDLPDLVRFLLGTGCCIGEAVAVRWKDVNLTDKPVVVDGTEIPPRSVWINGNIVSVKSKGLVRHGGKTYCWRVACRCRAAVTRDESRIQSRLVWFWVW
ncbi:hypothetical protein [Saccharopolyspora shandongensis]|uniref:hypothetical protein n=1 Tax=Saccharopolyspora shandongensis TaxID=418495 RepID=UPI000B847F9F|nr:hypothetical protein [Saccharopolyspora shandongensis]